MRTSFLPIEPDYDHPCLEPVLAETHGVILYQEQVLEVAMALAGFTAGQADALRRAMSRKRSREAMIALWDAVPGWREGARASRYEIARDGLQEAARLRRVRLPEGARGRLRRAGLSIVLAEVLLPGRVPLRAAQQPADGLLPLARADQRRQAARRADLRRRTST